MPASKPSIWLIPQRGIFIYGWNKVLPCICWILMVEHPSIYRCISTEWTRKQIFSFSSKHLSYVVAWQLSVTQFTKSIEATLVQKWWHSLMPKIGSHWVDRASRGPCLGLIKITFNNAWREMSVLMASFDKSNT